MISTKQMTAFLCRRFTPTTEAKIAKRYKVIINEDDSILSSNALIRRAQGVEVLFVTATERINAAVINSLSPRLKAIATLSVGYDHIDLTAARENKVQVLYTPEVLSDACAEIALLHILNACRRGYEADQLVRSGQWQGWAPTQLLGKGLVGQRLGIFGMGRIGRSIAQRAKGFGVEIHYHNRSPLKDSLEDGAIYHPNVESLLSVSDIFVIAVPSSRELKGVITAKRLALLPEKAVVVNISRGDLIDDAALINAINKKKIFGAGLDVFANEPNIHPAYRDCNRVFLSPHIGSATEATREAMGALLIDGLDAVWQGQTPHNQLL